MWHALEKWKVNTYRSYGQANLKGWNNFGNRAVDERMILKWTSIRIGSNGGFLVHGNEPSGSINPRMSLVVEWLVAFEEGLCSMKLYSSYTVATKLLSWVSQGSYLEHYRLCRRTQTAFFSHTRNVAHILWHPCSWNVTGARPTARSPLRQWIARP